MAEPLEKLVISGVDVDREFIATTFRHFSFCEL